VCSLLAEYGLAVAELVDVDLDPPGAWHWTILAETATPRPR
jgi:hypothetical protein